MFRLWVASEPEKVHQSKPCSNGTSLQISCLVGLSEKERALPRMVRESLLLRAKRRSVCIAVMVTGKALSV
jgi:hypothetical protein